MTLCRLCVISQGGMGYATDCIYRGVRECILMSWMGQSSLRMRHLLQVRDRYNLSCYATPTGGIFASSAFHQRRRLDRNSQLCRHRSGGSSLQAPASSTSTYPLVHSQPHTRAHPQITLPPSSQCLPPSHPQFMQPPLSPNSAAPKSCTSPPAALPSGTTAPRTTTTSLPRIDASSARPMPGSLSRRSQQLPSCHPYSVVLT